MLAVVVKFAEPASTASDYAAAHAEQWLTKKKISATQCAPNHQRLQVTDCSEGARVGPMVQEGSVTRPST